MPSAHIGAASPGRLTVVVGLMMVLLGGGAMCVGCVVGPATDVRERFNDAGEFTVDHCNRIKRERGGDDYDCYGDFVSDDGTVRASGVRMRRHRQPHAGDRLQALLDGPGDRTAYEPQDGTGYVLMATLGGLGFVVGCAGVATALARRHAITRPNR
jgi:hypothetical protein